jgi:hypothetical protein
LLITPQKTKDTLITMGRERQKKKNRSSVHKATLKPHGRTKTGKRKVNFLGDPIIAKNW